MFLLFERSKILDFETYQVNYLFVKNTQILGSMIDGGQKWFNFQENIIHIKMWPFTQLPIKRNLALKFFIITLVLSILNAWENIYGHG
jgi:hypothetical protein